MGCKRGRQHKVQLKERAETGIFGIRGRVLGWRSELIRCLAQAGLSGGKKNFSILKGIFIIQLALISASSL
jgi:hypothetical protein